MKKYVWILVLLIWILTACAPKPQPTEQSLLPNDDSYPNTSYPNNSYPNGDNPSPQPSVDLTPAESAAVAALSEITSLPADQINMVSSEAVTWSDGCLGVQRMGVMCTQAIVEGFKMVLEADGKEYEFHTNQNGSAVVLAEGDQVSGLIEKAVIAQLAENLGLQVSDIKLVSNKAVEFGDACLGVAMSNVTCAEAVTPGVIIVLEADGVQYEYHVSNDGKQVQPATLALTWTREGGIAGFCDNITVFLSGEVYVSNCKGDNRMNSLAKLVSADEIKQFKTWIGEFGQLELDASDPKGVADRMVVTINFFGLSNGQPVTADKDALFLWVQNLFQQMNSA
jgi:hypothetical protein